MQEEDAMTTHRMVVGVDGSRHSERAVKWCADHAERLDAEVVVVHVIEQPIYAGSIYPLVPPIPLTEEQRDELCDLVGRDWCKALADAGVEHRVVLVGGYPAEALLKVARDEDADMVVTGRRGLGGFAELLLGSTSHTLSHHLDRPLVIVP
jgi:nucleotide-binding universal stress UspA family protein